MPKIYIILIIAIVLIIKFCQKTLKIILSIPIIIIGLYCGILSVDLYKAKKLEEPTFAKINDEKSDDKVLTYKGIGYEIKMEKGLNNQNEEIIIKSDVYLFDKKIESSMYVDVKE